jgi:hypothetical protein
MYKNAFMVNMSPVTMHIHCETFLKKLYPISNKPRSLVVRTYDYYP